jgi:hypothetical protein
MSSLLRLLRPLGVGAYALTVATAFFPPPSAIRRHHSAPPAIVSLDTAIARMGGKETLERIERVRFEMMTLWQRLTFDDRPTDLIGTYELHSDLRNYALGAWRNTRRFVSGPALQEGTDIVLRDVSIRRLPPRPDGTASPWAPLSIAYVDERKEVFAFVPERLLLAARAAGDLRALPDTTIAGTPHARVSATIDGFPTTIFFRRRDGFLAMARYRAGQPNDFGLAPWGTMEVEMWYSRWAKYPASGAASVVYPTQWDVKRVGRLYKRLVVLAANFDAVAPADSFAVSDSLRAEFAAGPANRPMWDLPLDSAKVIESRFAQFGRPGQSQAAVKLGSKWLMLEGTAVPQRNETDLAWLKGSDRTAAPAGVLVTVANAGLGGAAWLVERKLPVFVAPGAAAPMAATLANRNQPRTALTVIAKPQWLHVGGDSLWVESIDYPDLAGSLVAYVPSLRWVYSGAATSPLTVDMLVARIRERGWPVDRIGSLRAVVQPLPARTASR